MKITANTYVYYVLKRNISLKKWTKFLTSLLIIIPLALCGENGAWGQPRHLAVDVWLEAGIPDQLSIMGTPQRDVALDSVWMDQDGWYHLELASFEPGLYHLKFGESPSVPLLLTGVVGKSVRIWADGRDLEGKMRVEGCEPAQAYIRAHAAQERYEAWRKAAERLTFRRDKRDEDVRGLHTLVENERKHFEGVVHDGLQTPDSMLRCLLWLMYPAKTTDLDEWFPAQALLAPIVILQAGGLRTRLTGYLLAQRDSLLTHEAQAERYKAAISLLAERTMHTEVAHAIRSQIIYLLAGTAFDEVASHTETIPFGGLPPLSSIRINPRPASGKDALNLTALNLKGRRRPLISKKSDYTLVVVWSIWCPHCQSMISSIHALCHEISPKRLSVTSLCENAPSAQLSDYLSTRGWTWQNLVIPEDESEYLNEQLNLHGTPSMLLYGRNGELISKPGIMEELRAILRETKLLP